VRENKRNEKNYTTVRIIVYSIGQTVIYSEINRMLSVGQVVRTSETNSFKSIVPKFQLQEIQEKRGA
jgi:hypothetical protein